MARLTWRELQSELPEELRRTDATALLEEPAPKRARRAGEEDALFAPLPAFGRAGGGRRLKSKSRRRAKPTSRGSGRAGPLRRYNSSAAASLASASLDVSGLARRLVDLHSRLTPVAAGAQESVASRLRTLRPAPVEVQERKRLLTQLETLASCRECAPPWPSWRLRTPAARPSWTCPARSTRRLTKRRSRWLGTA